MNFNKELLLSASRKSWKMSATHGTENDRNYLGSKGKPGKHKELWQDIWRRDRNKCYFCSFESSRHQEIHHLNDDHEDNNPNNLVTVCPLCHQCFHLDTVSLTGGGKIIWLPEMSQQELNHICRALFIAQMEEFERERAVNQGQHFDDDKLLRFIEMANNIEASLLNRAAIVEQQFQMGASDPATFANALINLPDQSYANRGATLKPFKLLGNKNRFLTQTKFWKQNTFKDVPVSEWGRLIIDPPAENQES